MKKQSVWISVLSVLVVISSVSLFSCKTMDLKTNTVGLSENASISVKDYEIIGSIRVESEEIVSKGPLGLYKSHNGSHITYDMLLVEAHKQGADDLINVRIDTIKDSNTFLFGILGQKKTYKYIGTALAIKYSDSIQTSIGAKSSIQVPSKEEEITLRERLGF